MRRKILTVIQILLVCIIVFAGANIVRIYHGYRKGQRFYEGLREAHVSVISGAETSPRADAAEQLPQTCPITVDFDALLHENGEITGWLYSPDGKVNYPVVQAENNDKYLRHDLYGNYLVSGTVFADCGCTAPGECANYIVYGHNMDDGSMFGSLLGYKEQSYYDAQPTLYYLTPKKNFKIELLTGGVVDRDSLIYDCNADADELCDFIEGLYKNGTFAAQSKYSDGDRLITLSTCSYEYDSARFVIVGRLTELD